VEWNIDPATEQLYVPPMMLQTLAENAVKHGIAKLTKGGTVRISAERGEGIVLLTVANSGVLDHPVHNGNSTGIGLRNTRKRLQLLYGDQAELTIMNSNGMVTTHVSIPLEQ
jgi:LytS/YehU family sensor histidine kinase